MWQEQRRFMLKTLSDLGMGKRDTMEEVIRQEAEQVVLSVLEVTIFSHSFLCPTGHRGPEGAVRGCGGCQGTM